jgi:hypothetical protein
MRLSNGHRRWVYAAAVTLFATGALWLVFHYFVRVDGEFGEIPHPLESWWLRLHGGAAMWFLVVVGSLLPVHVRRGWHQRRNVVAGVVLAGAALLLTVSGYGLYYLGGEYTRQLFSLLHWVIGLASGGLLVWHVLSGHASRSSAVEVPAPAPVRERADTDPRGTA